MPLFANFSLKILLSDIEKSSDSTPRQSFLGIFQIPIVLVLKRLNLALVDVSTTTFHFRIKLIFVILFVWIFYKYLHLPFPDSESIMLIILKYHNGIKFPFRNFPDQITISLTSMSVVELYIENHAED